MAALANHLVARRAVASVTGKRAGMGAKERAGLGAALLAVVALAAHTSTVNISILIGVSRPFSRWLAARSDTFNMAGASRPLYLVAVVQEVALSAARVVPATQRSAARPLAGEAALAGTRHLAHLKHVANLVSAISPSHNDKSCQRNVLTSCSPKQELEDRERAREIVKNCESKIGSVFVLCLYTYVIHWYRHLTRGAGQGLGHKGRFGRLLPRPGQLHLTHPNQQKRSG